MQELYTKIVLVSKASLLAYAIGGIVGKVSGLVNLI